MDHGGLPQWLAEQTGLFGNTPEAVRLVIWINSGGGDVLAAIEAINLMRASSIPITTIINGSAESAALLIATAGHSRWAFENSWGMGHHFSTGLEGSYHQLQDTLKHHEILNATMMDILRRGSTMLKRDIKDLLLGRQDTWLTAAELLEHGLIDEVLPIGENIRARFINGSQKAANKNTKGSKQVRSDDT